MSSRRQVRGIAFSSLLRSLPFSVERIASKKVQGALSTELRTTGKKVKRYAPPSHLYTGSHFTLLYKAVGIGAGCGVETRDIVAQAAGFAELCRHVWIFTPSKCYEAGSWDDFIAESWKRFCAVERWRWRFSPKWVHRQCQTQFEGFTGEERTMVNGKDKGVFSLIRTRLLYSMYSMIMVRGRLC